MAQGRLRSAILVVLVGLGIQGLASCHRWIAIDAADPSQSLVVLDEGEIPPLDDDLDRESLGRAVRQSLAFLERLSDQRTFVYGPYKPTVHDIRLTLMSFLRLLERHRDFQSLAVHVRRDFIWFKAAGRDLFGTVLFSGYYLPVLEGRLRPGDEFRYPIYRLPPDLVEVDLGSFEGQPTEGRRLVGRVEGRRLVPYYSRAEIDAGRVLEGRGVELVWLKDPVDRFFLHIQGSGQIVLEDGRKIQVNYAGTNGHPYTSIGKMLLDQGAIPLERMSMQAIRAYLMDHPERMDGLFYSNRSYVFFREVKEGPLGSLGVPLTPGRSIATDGMLFPKGALAFIRTKRPVLDERCDIASWCPFSRFVLNQDTGSAIRGAGRVDLYCGSGKEAEVMAGHLRHEGSLYFLLARKDP